MQQNRSTGISFSLRFEGGFVDDPEDPGGATNKGITLATYRRVRGGDNPVDRRGLLSVRRALNRIAQK